MACILHFNLLSFSQELEEMMMNKNQLMKKIAYLEFVHDQLSTELSYIDRLLKSIGFPEGLQSAKKVALDLLKEKQQ